MNTRTFLIIRPTCRFCSVPLLGAFVLLATVCLYAQRMPRPTGSAAGRASTSRQSKSDAQTITWTEQNTAVGLDQNGMIVSLQNKSDPEHMEWVSGTGRQWALPVSRENGKLVAWAAPRLAFMATVPQSTDELVFTHGDLSLDVTQALYPDGSLGQTFRLHNDSRRTISLAEGDFGIRIPLPDNYPAASKSIARRSNVHIWTGGGSAWIEAQRMNGTPPHLALVLKEGSLPAYSIMDRPSASNDRGTFVVHPPAVKLAPGDHITFSWTLFWNTGWDDFFTHAMEIPGFIRMQADRYTVFSGEPIHITAQISSVPRTVNGDGAPIPLKEGSPLATATLTNNKQPVSVHVSGNSLEASFTPAAPGEQLFELTVGDQHTTLRAYVSPAPMQLIDARVRFLMAHQQKNAPGQPADGAFLAYDNQTHQQILDKTDDHNAGRERVGMGVLLALYLPRVQDASLRAEITHSLDRYFAFVTKHLQDPTGKVFNDVDDPRQRLDNYPWVARLYLAMFDATKEPKYLDAFARTLRAFYANGGERSYPLDLPITDGLAAESAAGRTAEHAELLALFQKHADRLASAGLNMQPNDANYQQASVASACSVLLETYLATHDSKYLDAAQPFLTALFAFNGQQPDYHLNDLSIRHWDDFRFGKEKLYGDTFPQSWSSLDALVLGDLAMVEPEHAADNRARGQGILANNLSLFRADGSASCAYVYPLTIDDRAGRFYDPWANDQDWALVHWLLLNR